MKIVQGWQVGESAGTSHRAGRSSHQNLLDGAPGDLGNFSLVIARSPGRYSPRHRHNFEQFRYQLQGAAEYGRTGKLEPGMVGYFPEGVHYGPQTQKEGEELAVLVLQCGGASGQGYLGRAEQARATAELSELGDFKNGVFRRGKDTHGKRNMDAFQAIWEHVNARPLVYPESPYPAPAFLDPAEFAWEPVTGAPGVAEKRLGVFTECGSAAGLVKLDPGAAFRATGGRDIYFTLSGAGTVADAPMGFSTTLYLEKGEEAEIHSSAETEILHFHLPDLDRLDAAVGSAAGQTAAE